jgi:amino acid transporter
MLSKIKELLIGPPLPTHSIERRQLSILQALAAFSPGALASIAYANQEIYLGLVVAGSAGLAFTFPLGLAITGLLITVALSYFQIIFRYPSGGGSYEVARKNLGELPGLLAAAALIIDYLVNVAVSLTSGVAALASAFPALWPYRVVLALVLLLAITLINLRGLQEAGSILSVPVYLFLASFLAMLIYGFFRLVSTGVQPLPSAGLSAAEPVTLFLILHTFATGATALTGIEVISNGVPAFQPPKERNAGRTLIVMAVLMGFLFLGSNGLTQFLGVTAGPQETILSALSRRLFNDSILYYIVQFATLGILTVAANTSFAGFPRLASILAKDGYLQRQFTSLGDRLVFSNGILLLGSASAVLIALFAGNTHALIPLFVVVAYLAFTLSQTGMVAHWLRVRGNGWQWKCGINGLGALVSGTTLAVVCISKFTEGAWVTVILIPLLVLLFREVSSHYKKIRRELSLRGLPPSLKPAPPARVVIPISGIHRGMIGAVTFAQSISAHVTAVFVEMEPGSGERIQKDWMNWWPDIPLVVIPSPFRSMIRPLMEFLNETDQRHNDGQLAVVVLPEFIPNHWWESLLHNQTAWQIKAALLYGSRFRNLERVVINVPFHLER